MSTTRTADVCDERGGAIASLPTQLRSLGAVHEFDGPVRTVRCPEDNSLLHEAVAEPGDGAVLVVDGGGSLRCELMGGLMAQRALDNGWAGLVVHGAVRDTHELERIPLGIKALGTNPLKSTKTGAGDRDVDVVIDGVLFRPGAHVWCDRDGVVVERSGRGGDGV